METLLLVSWPEGLESFSEKERWWYEGLLKLREKLIDSVLVTFGQKEMDYLNNCSPFKAEGFLIHEYTKRKFWEKV